MMTLRDAIGEELGGKEDAGFHAAAVGTTVEDISKEEGGEKGPAVVLLVGWDSPEKHMAGKEVGGEYYPATAGT